MNIVQQRIEPYHSLLYHFDRSFLIMNQTLQIQQLDPETLKDFQELHDAREQALKQLGIEEGRKQVAKNLLDQGIPHDVIAKATGLSPEQITALEPQNTLKTP
jgi:hypothetical protein